MPRDLFGTVTRPSISIGNRKWYTVPVSLLSHAVILATIVIAPIIAAPYLPDVLGSDNPDYVITILPPPPAPPAKRTRLKPITNPDAAPIVPPDGITPEKPIDFTIDDVPASVVGGAEDIDRVIAAPPIVATPPPVAQGPVRVGTHSIRTPVKTRDVRPVYPRMAQEARIEGVVIIEATIGETGQVSNARVLRGVPLLEQAAIDAVRQWEFTPSMLNGVAVPVIMTVTVTFTLSR